MNERYILDENHKAIPVGDLTTRVRWMQKKKINRVALTQVTPEISVSTVFLGLDHSFGGYPPLLFETIVFGGPMDGEMDRYTTWDEAEAGHEAMVEKVRARLARKFNFDKEGT